MKLYKRYNMFVIGVLEGEQEEKEEEILFEELIIDINIKY